MLNSIEDIVKKPDVFIEENSILRLKTLLDQCQRKHQGDKTIISISKEYTDFIMWQIILDPEIKEEFFTHSRINNNVNINTITDAFFYCVNKIDSNTNKYWLEIDQNELCKSIPEEWFNQLNNSNDIGIFELTKQTCSFIYENSPSVQTIVMTSLGVFVAYLILEKFYNHFWSKITFSDVDTDSIKKAIIEKDKEIVPGSKNSPDLRIDENIIDLTKDQFDLQNNRFINKINSDDWFNNVYLSLTQYKTFSYNPFIFTELIFISNYLAILLTTFVLLSFIFGKINNKKELINKSNNIEVLKTDNYVYKDEIFNTGNKIIKSNISEIKENLGKEPTNLEINRAIKKSILINTIIENLSTIEKRNQLELISKNQKKSKKFLKEIRNILTGNRKERFMALFLIKKGFSNIKKISK